VTLLMPASSPGCESMISRLKPLRSVWLLGVVL
jgi:hypothetical protein